MQQSLIEDTINTLARGIARAAAENSAATAEAQRLLGRAVVAAANEAAWRTLYEQLAAPLAALVRGSLADLAAEMVRDCRRSAGARGTVLQQAPEKFEG